MYFLISTLPSAFRPYPASRHLHLSNWDGSLPSPLLNPVQYPYIQPELLFSAAQAQLFAYYTFLSLQWPLNVQIALQLLSGGFWFANSLCHLLGLNSIAFIRSHWRFQILSYIDLFESIYDAYLEIQSCRSIRELVGSIQAIATPQVRAKHTQPLRLQAWR